MPILRVLTEHIYIIFVSVSISIFWLIMSTQKKITSPFPFKSPYMTHEGHVSLKQNGTESKYSISLSDAFPHPTHFPEAQLCLQ